MPLIYESYTGMGKQLKKYLICFLLTISASTYAYATSDSKISVKVVDEQGAPIEGARVGVGFIIYKVWSSDEIPVVGFTDTSGAFTAAATADDDLGFNVKKDGYYQSSGDYKFKKVQNGRWEPWNPEVTVVLRKKENPVPMYARDTNESKMTIPTSGQEVGFDLIEFDWLPPYGKGKSIDLLLALSGSYTDQDNYDMNLKVRFGRKYDGIQRLRQDIRQGSMLKLSRFAPDEGYEQEAIKLRKRQTGKRIEDNFDDLNNYYFRTRSEEKDGKLMRAMYGKIHGDIKFFPKSKTTATVVFKYFLNPDYTRNMEFGGNLFKGLNVGMD